jgi:hypothetical protein
MRDQSTNLDLYLDNAISTPQRQYLEEKSGVVYVKRLLHKLQRRDRCLQCLNSVRPHEIIRLNQMFYLISDRLPEILSFHIGLASRLNSQNYSDYKAHNIYNSLAECSLLMQEAGLMYYSRRGGVDGLSLLDDLRASIKGELALLSTLVNVQKPRLYHIIENLTIKNNHSSTQAFFPLRAEDLKRRLAERLMLIGCSRQLNLKLTGLHHQTINTIYANSPCKIPAQRLARGKQHQLMYHQTKSLFTMFLLEMYTLSSNILHNRHHTLMPLAYKPREELNAAIACGAYECARFIYTYSFMHAWSEDKSYDYMPYFDEFVKILEEYLEGSAVAVACARCHTPYLFFKTRSGDSDFNKSESKKLCCPKCNTHAEYLLCE